MTSTRRRSGRRTGAGRWRRVHRRGVLRAESRLRSTARGWSSFLIRGRCQRGVLGLERDELLATSGGRRRGWPRSVRPFGYTAVSGTAPTNRAGSDAGAPCPVCRCRRAGVADAWGAGREMDDIGEEPVAEQCDGLAQFITQWFNGVVVGRGTWPRETGTLRTSPHVVSVNEAVGVVRAELEAVRMRNALNAVSRAEHARSRRRTRGAGEQADDIVRT